MTTQARISKRRGQPLAAIAALLAGWVALRAAIWTGLLAPVDVRREPMFATAPTMADGRPLATISALATDPAGAPGRLPSGRWIAPAAAAARLLPPDLRQPRPGIAGGGAERPPIAIQPVDRLGRAERPPEGNARGFRSELPLPVRFESRGSRWTVDSWVLFRRGSGVPAAAGGLFPSYGASQAGGAIRYALLPASPRAPQAFVRASRTLGFAQGELATGLSLRPLAGIPVRLLGEARVQSDGGRIRVVPAGALVSDLRRSACLCAREAKHMRRPAMSAGSTPHRSSTRRRRSSGRCSPPDPAKCFSAVAHGPAGRKARRVSTSVRERA